MDVLHLIKTEHDSIRSGLNRLLTISGVRQRREAVDELVHDLGVHLTLERDYIYPEVQGLFQGADDLIDEAVARNGRLERRAKALKRLVLKPAAEQKGFPNKVSDLDGEIQDHFGQSEEVLMPKMRGLIRTEDREDLGEVFLDVKEDLSKAEDPPAGGPTSGNRRKKRA